MTIAVDAKAAGFEEAKLARIGEHLRQRYIEPEKIPGCQVLVSRHGIPAYFESIGLMDRERSKPMRDDTIFRIYSMSKPITSVALMMQCTDLFLLGEAKKYGSMAREIRW